MSLGILIVDDSDYMRSRLKSALGDDEYHVVAEAPNGAWAVKKYQEHRDEVDLVLMDIVMEKANGVKATAAIKELDAEVKIIMCTSVGQHKKMKLARKAGADGYITKPFSDADVATAISEVLGEGETVGDVADDAEDADERDGVDDTTGDEAVAAAEDEAVADEAEDEGMTEEADTTGDEAVTEEADAAEDEAAVGDTGGEAGDDAEPDAGVEPT